LIGHFRFFVLPYTFSFLFYTGRGHAPGTYYPVARAKPAMPGYNVQQPKQPMDKTTDIYFPSGEPEKTVISNIWRLTDHDLQNRKEIILPKGTVEVIFNFSDRVNYFNPVWQRSKSLSTVFINGINCKPFHLIKSGRQQFLGIQLNTVGLRLLFNLSVKEFNDNVYDGNEVLPGMGLLAEELFAAPAFPQQVDIIIRWIRSRISRLSCRYSINRALQLQCLSAGHHLTVKQLSEAICLSDRQLRRFSTDWFGMNTEELVHYNKYLTGLHLLHHSTRPLTEIGLQAGYYDQSHFIRAFKQYTELSPKQYRAANAEFIGHLAV
jgi:AraC-like DNA-binding protein